jgi:hypothetical protein
MVNELDGFVHSSNHLLVHLHALDGFVHSSNHPSACSPTCLINLQINSVSSAGVLYWQLVLMLSGEFHYVKLKSSFITYLKNGLYEKNNT